MLEVTLKEKIFKFCEVIYKISLVLFLFSCSAYAIGAIFIASNQKLNITDIFNTIAQLATSATFIFAIYQYRKNGEKERQIILFNEAKLLIEKMCLASSKISKEKCTDIEINKFIALMSNLGTDFNAIYKSVTDETYKTMIRMRWQDMHYNNLSPALKTLTIDALFENLSLDKDHKGFSFFNARFNPSVTSKPGILQEYYFTNNVLEGMSIGESLVKNFDDLFLFEQYYFNNENTNDLMQGLMSKLDFRVTSPLLASINKKKNGSAKSA